MDDVIGPFASDTLASYRTITVPADAMYELTVIGDSAPGSIVELRSFEDAKGERRVALAVRSDLSIEAQATANGATWLDRQLVARDPVDLGGGFGLEVKQTMEARAAHLIQDGMARRDGERLTLRVADDGRGLPEAPVERVGLGNTRARLRLLYADRQRCELRNADGGGAIAEIALPWRTTP